MVLGSVKGNGLSYKIALLGHAILADDNLDGAVLRKTALGIHLSRDELSVIFKSALGTESCV